RGDEEPRRSAVDERPDRLVRAGRILDQQEEQALVADLDPLEAPERGREPLQPGHDLLDTRAERARERSRGDGVVDVVQTRQGERDALRSLGRDELKGGALESVQ